MKECAVVSRQMKGASQKMEDEHASRGLSQFILLLSSGQATAGVDA